MKFKTAALILLAAAALPVSLQAQRRPYVRAEGQGTVSARPDQVTVSVSVITQAETAVEASDLNAARTQTVIERLRGLLGPSADLRTVNYSLNPNYRFPQNAPPVLIGFTVNNTVEVTSPDLGSAGRIIDTATQAGVTTIAGLRFGLKDSVSQQMQALRLATQQARMQAEAIASGLGGRIGSIVSAEESGSLRVASPEVRLGAGGGAIPTPVETGMVTISASVVLEADLVM